MGRRLWIGDGECRLQLVGNKWLDATKQLNRSVDFTSEGPGLNGWNARSKPSFNTIIKDMVKGSSFGKFGYDPDRAANKIGGSGLFDAVRVLDDQDNNSLIIRG